MTILRHRPHPNEAALLAPLAKRPANVPAERPRGVEPRRLPCAPGTSRAVLDELLTVDAAMTILLNINNLLRLPDPCGDWTTQRTAAERQINARIGEELATAPTRTLDGVQNGWLFGVHQLTAPVLAELDDIEGDLVDAVAEWIAAEVTV